jgi:hypothetical protein
MVGPALPEACDARSRRAFEFIEERRSKMHRGDSCVGS